MTDETSNETVAPGVVTISLKGSHSGSYTSTAGIALKDVAGFPDLDGFVLRNPKGHMMSASKPLEAGEYIITTSEKASGG